MHQPDGVSANLRQHIAGREESAGFLAREDADHRLTATDADKPRWRDECPGLVDGEKPRQNSDDCEAVGPAGIAPSRKVLTHQLLGEDALAPGAREAAELLEEGLLSTVGKADSSLVGEETLDLGCEGVHRHT